MLPSTLLSKRTFAALALPALTTLFGLQMLRVLLPSFVWYLGDAVGVSYATVGLAAFGPFLVAFLAAAFRRLLGMRRALIVVVGGVGLLRLLEQFSTDPAMDLALVTFGTVLFTFFLPVYLSFIRGQNGDAPRQFGLGFLLGLALDTTIHGALGTLDLSWQPGWAAIVVVLVLVLVQWYLLARTSSVEAQATDTSFLSDLPMAALGLFVFLAGVVLQNVAHASALTGWSPPLALGLILLTNVVGLAIAGLPIPSRGAVLSITLLCGVLLTLAMALFEASGWVAVAALFVGNLTAFLLIVLIFTGLSAPGQRDGLWRATVANGIGWLIFVVMALLYYISYDIQTGIPNSLMPPFAAGLISLAAVGAVRALPRASAATTDWTPATVALTFLLVPLVLLIGWREPTAVAGKGFPVRVMTYNLHNSFNTDGRLDPEAIAQAIEQAGPDIIALQEVERGWYIDSSLDLLTWLSQRLRLPYIYGPTADPVWGNAILSRYPVKEWGSAPLSPRTLLLKRGFLWARIDLGGGDDLLLITTHYHHIEKDTEIRQQQSPEIVKFWNQRTRTVFLGDLNASPDAKEIAMLRNAGLKDAFATIGTGAGLSWPANKPEMRIDYIWFSPDLTVRDLFMPQSTASDHLGVAVTVSK